MQCQIDTLSTYHAKRFGRRLLTLKTTNQFYVDQEERSKGVEAFRSAKKDVLVATDVASKGLDFPNIQHVINYDMPDDIENYGEFI